MGSYLSVPATTKRDQQRCRAGTEASTKSATKQTGLDAITVVTVDNATAGTTGVDGKTTTATAAADNHPSVNTAVPQPAHIDQCGLEDDKERWVVRNFPERIRSSQLTAEDRVKYTTLVEHIFSDDSVLGYRIAYEPMDVFKVMQGVIPYLESEPMLIEDLPFGINVVGDLQGQLHDLDRVFEANMKDGKPGWQCAKYIFLGNYVGGGRQSLDVIMALFCLKMLYPDDFFLLRGNREFIEENAGSGFGYEIYQRYGEKIGNSLFYTCNETFCWLSAAAILGNDYLCVHSGISAGLFTRRTMRGITKPHIHDGDDYLVHDVMWSEPCRGMKGTAFNIRAGTSFLFGMDALAFAFSTMEVKVVLRSHTLINAGHECCWKCLYTVYTATDYNDEGNHGAIAVIDKHGKLSLSILRMSEKRSNWEKKWSGLDAFHSYDRKAAREAKDTKDPKEAKTAKQ